MVSKMQDKCPNCGETLSTRTIKKELGPGSIDYPVAQVCPKCNWSKDLTGAGDIVSKPVIATGEVKKEKVKPHVVASAPPKKQSGSSEPSFNINKLVTTVLAIIVLGALAWAFYPAAQPAQVDNTPAPTATPAITQNPAATPTITSTAAPEATATGVKILVKLDSRRGFIPDTKTIKPGDEIIFRNTGSETVTLVSNDGLFEDKLLAYDKEYRSIFGKSGTFSFQLKNTDLKGTIVVEP